MWVPLLACHPWGCGQLGLSPPLVQDQHRVLQHTERMSGYRDGRETLVLLGLPPHQAQARASISWEEKTEVVPPLPLL